MKPAVFHSKALIGFSTRIEFRLMLIQNPGDAREIGIVVSEKMYQFSFRQHAVDHQIHQFMNSSVHAGSRLRQIPFLIQFL